MSKNKMPTNILSELLLNRYKFLEQDDLDTTTQETIFKSLEDMGLYIEIKTGSGYMYKSSDDFKTSNKYKYIDIKGKVINCEKIQFDCPQSLKTLNSTPRQSKCVLSCGSKIFCDGNSIYNNENKNWVINVECEEKDLMRVHKQRITDIKEIEQALKIDFKGYADERRIAKHIVFSCLSDVNFDIIDEEEEKILSLAVRGSHTYVVAEEEFTNCYCYDRNSSYSATLKSSRFKIPVGGVYKKHITEYTKTEEPTLYKLILRGETDHRIISPKKGNWYTDVEFEQIRKLNINFEFCKGINFMAYKKYIPSGVIFESIIHKLYKLKLNGNKFIKLILSCIWGVISAKDIKRYSFEQLENMTDQEYNTIKKTIISHDLEEKKATCKGSTDFKYVFGRMKPFILAESRVTVTKKINKLIDDGHKIYRCHTDSFITELTPKEMTKYIDINDCCGNYKVEKYFNGTFRYKNLNELQQKIRNGWETYRHEDIKYKNT